MDQEYYSYRDLKVWTALRVATPSPDRAIPRELTGGIERGDNPNKCGVL